MGEEDLAARVLLCLRRILACTIDTSLWVIKSHLHLHGASIT